MLFLQEEVTTYSLLSGGKTLDSAEMLQKLRVEKQARLLAEEEQKRTDIATGVVSGRKSGQ